MYVKQRVWKWIVLLAWINAIGVAGTLCIQAAGCVHAPPTLSPAAQAAFNNTRVIKALDILRDTAVAANAQTPPLLSTATTRNVVTYHESALKTIHALSTGWQNTVKTGLEEVLKDLPAAERAQLAPYVALVSTLIAEVR